MKSRSANGGNAADRLRPGRDESLRKYSYVVHEDDAHRMARIMFRVLVFGNVKIAGAGLAILVLTLAAVFVLITGFPLPRLTGIIPLAALAFYGYPLVKDYSGLLAGLKQRWVPGKTYVSEFVGSSFTVPTGRGLISLDVNDCRKVSRHGMCVFVYSKTGNPPSSIPTPLFPDREIELFRT